MRYKLHTWRRQKVCQLIVRNKARQTDPLVKVMGTVTVFSEGIWLSVSYRSGQVSGNMLQINYS